MKKNANSAVLHLMEVVATIVPQRNIAMAAVPISASGAVLLLQVVVVIIVLQGSTRNSQLSKCKKLMVGSLKINNLWVKLPVDCSV